MYVYTITMEKKVCLITGGAGFIGSHLVDMLLAMGHKVFAVDNLLTGSEDNLADAKKNSGFTFIKHDVAEPLDDLAILRSNDLSFVFHLASPASVVDYQKYPEETARVNSLGTINMLEYARKTGVKFLFASTSEVYGDPKEHPQKESYWGNVNPNGIRACYDESKRFGEMMTMLYVRKYGLDARIVRIFNTYGPRMRKNDGRVVSNFINQAIEGNPITVYGDGSQTRSFCYVDDMVDGLMKAMFSEGTRGEVINLGNPEEFTMIDLAQKIKQITGSSSDIVYTKLPEDDPTQRQPDITKARELLGWEPQVSLEEGLSKTIEYYRNLLNDNRL